MTLHIKNDKPAGAAGGLSWKGGDVVEVSDEVGATLVAIADAGFYTVDPDEKPAKPAKKLNTEVDPKSVPAE